MDFKEWQNFYILVGTGAAAFAGFVYLAVSIHAKAIAQQEDEALNDLINTTVFTFVGLFVLALSFLLPSTTTTV